jgi:O-acetyl-ADP-ribose deacetylase (regulator of RNase III)
MTIRETEEGKMRRIQGDLLQYAPEGTFDVIVHGCNCFCTMGAGIAKSIKTQFPEAYRADMQTSKGDKTQLGTCSSAAIEGINGKLIVVNAYTQYDYRGKGVKVDYDALRKCMKWVKVHFSGHKIGLPQIGAGLAGGDWARISQIIEKELDGEDVTLVEYAPTS